MSEVSRLAVLYTVSGVDPEDAMRWASEAIALQGNLVWYRHNAAVCYLRENKPQPAVNLLTRALSDAPLWIGNGLIYCTLARAYLELGDFVNGKHWFDTAEARMAAWEKEGKTWAYRFPVKYWIIDFLEAQVQLRIARSLLESKTPADKRPHASKPESPQ